MEDFLCIIPNAIYKYMDWPTVLMCTAACDRGHAYLGLFCNYKEATKGFI